MKKFSEDDTAKAMAYLLKNKRNDSISIEDMEKLQNITTSKEFKPNLIEDAHPDFVVVMNAYDAMNGAVFNSEQRHHFIRKLIDRPVTTQLTNYKLAAVELSKELTKVAEFLETEDVGLSKKADACLFMLENKFPNRIVKNAWIWAAVGAGTAAAAMLYWSQHSNPPAKTIEENGRNLLDLMKTIIGSGNASYQDTYNAQAKAITKKAAMDVVKIVRAWKSANSLLSKIEFTYDIQNKIKSDPSFLNQVTMALSSLDSFQNMIGPILTVLDGFANQVENSQFQQHAIKSRGTVSGVLDQMNDSMGGVLEGGSGMFATYWDKLSRSIRAFEKTCKDQADYYHGLMDSVQNSGTTEKENDFGNDILPTEKPTGLGKLPGEDIKTPAKPGIDLSGMPKL
jgi:hypothetical protein